MQLAMDWLKNCEHIMTNAPDSQEWLVWVSCSSKLHWHYVLLTYTMESESNLAFFFTNMTQKG